MSVGSPTLDQTFYSARVPSLYGTFRDKLQLVLSPYPPLSRLNSLLVKDDIFGLVPDRFIRLKPTYLSAPSVFLYPLSPGLPSRFRKGLTSLVPSLVPFSSHLDKRVNVLLLLLMEGIS